MIKVGILGDIGSGKSYVAKQFGFPVFNADNEVSKIYKKDKKCYIKLKKAVPKYILSFPINKMEITKSILSNQKNLKKIIKIVHPIVQLKMNNFIKKNKNKRIVILDVPLL
jgi:Dephospho-CoA kinase